MPFGKIYVDNIEDSNGTDFDIANASTTIAANTAAIATKADDAATTAALATKADDTATTAALATKANDAATTAALATKADDTATTNALALKADTSAMNAALATKADDTATTDALALKADTSAMNAALATKADDTATTNALALKADTSTVNAALATKADDTATTNALATKADDTATTNALALKADTSTVNAALATKADDTATTNALATKADDAATTTALAGKADLVGGKLSTSQIPDLAVTEFLGVAANQTAMLALSGQKGDWCNRSDTGQMFIIVGDDPTTIGDWAAVSYPASPVVSVAGKTGAVTLTQDDIGSGAVSASTIDATGLVSTDSAVFVGDFDTSDAAGAGSRVQTGIVKIQRPNTTPDSASALEIWKGTEQVLQVAVDGNITTDGNINLDGHLDMGDSRYILLGNHDDLKLYHNGSDSYIQDEGTGALKLTTDGAGIDLQKGTSEYLARFYTDGPVELFHNNSKKLETKSDGVDITGELQCDTLDCDGSADIAGFIVSAGLGSRGARLGNLKVGYDNLYNTIQTDNGTSDLHLQYSSSGLVYIGTNGLVWHSNNDGSGSGLDADTLDGVQGSSYLRSDVNDTFTQTLYVQELQFAGVGGNSNNGTPSYAIYQEAGAWSNPFPDLMIGYHTGIKLGAHSSYNGIRFYSDSVNGSQVFTVNDGSTGLGSGNVYVNNSLQAGSSLRAPILYDSDDTNYYVDMSSYSYVKYIGRRDHNTGFFVGSYNNVAGNSYYSNPIYAIGSSYMPGTTGLSNFYGIGYSHPNASFISMTNANDWGFYVAADGDARVYLDGGTGNVSCTGNITAYASDRRLKTNIKPISNALDKLLRINGVEYDWVDNCQEEYEFSPTQMHEVGVIAQEIQKVLPEVVLTAPFNGNYTAKTGWKQIKERLQTEENIAAKVEGREAMEITKAVAKQEFEKLPLKEREAMCTDHNFLTVDYERITPLLIEAIKELSVRLTSLESQS